MSSELLSPVTSPGLLYPQLGWKPRKKHYQCPRCAGNMNTRMQLQLVRKQDMVFGFRCHDCGKHWFISSELILNDVLEEQIQRIANFTKQTEKEFGALVIKTPEGIRLDMVEIGEDMSVSFAQTHELRQGEKIVGTWHCVVSPSTLVETENGRKPIASIKVGDKVLTEDGNYHKVLDTKRRIYEGKIITIYIDYINDGGRNQQITVTPEHKILVERNRKRQWLRAEELTLEDLVLIPEYMFGILEKGASIKFVTRKITKIKESNMEKHAVYNLEVEDVHSFVAGRIIVSNCHPITDEPSDWDIGTFLRDDWEKISIVSGAKGHLNVMVKTGETVKIEDVKKWVEENKNLDFSQKGETYGFLIFRGRANHLKLISGISNNPVSSLERLLRETENN